MGQSEGMAKEKNRYVGLHDNIIYSNPGEVKMHNGSMMMPLRKLANNLYAETASTSAYIRIVKNGHELSYRYASGEIKYDGVIAKDQSITEIDGTLYVSIRSMAEHFGFKVDYLSNIRTARIYSDTYPHLSHIQYVQRVAPTISKWESEGASNEQKPTKPTKPAKPTKPTKANVYLTFDDGPTASTTKNNETLNRYGVDGTFFFLGSQMKAHPQIVKTVAKSGHFIGTHSMTHEQAKVYGTTQSFMNEMNQAINLLAQLTGEKSNLIRVPYGSVPHLTPAMSRQLKQNGYKIWDWDVDSNDWKYTTSQYNQIVKNVQNGVTNNYRAGNQHIVVLMHDRPQTAKALPAIIDWLKKEGYTLEKYNPSNHIVKNFRKDQGL